MKKLENGALADLNAVSVAQKVEAAIARMRNLEVEVWPSWSSMVEKIVRDWPDGMNFLALHYILVEVEGVDEKEWCFIPYGQAVLRRLRDSTSDKRYAMFQTGFSLRVHFVIG